MDPNAKDFDELEERIGASDEEDEGDEEDDVGDANELERTDDEWSGGSDMDGDDEGDEEALPTATPAAAKAT